MLKSIELMSKISGIGENKLRELINDGKIEYVQNGNKKLLADSAIWDWYNREKTIAITAKEDRTVMKSEPQPTQPPSQQKSRTTKTRHNAWDFSR